MAFDLRLLTSGARLEVLADRSKGPGNETPEPAFAAACPKKLPESGFPTPRILVGDYRRIRACTEDALRRGLKMPLMIAALSGRTIFSEEMKQWMAALPDVEAGILFVRGECAAILEKVNEILGDYRWWRERLEHLEAGMDGVSGILSDTALMLECPVCLINTGYQLLDARGMEKADFEGRDLLTEKGHIGADMFGRLRTDPRMCVVTLRQGVSAIAWLIIQTGDDVRKEALMPYIDLCSAALEQRMRRSDISPGRRRIEFEQLVYDLIEMKIADSEDILGRIEMMDLKFAPYFCCAVIRGNDSDEPLNPHILALKTMVPGAEIALYQRRIVMLVRLETRDVSAWLSEQVVSYLKEKRLKAGVSDGVSRIEYFRTFYIMALQALKYGTMAEQSRAGSGRNPDKSGSPVYFFEDYRMLHMVELCREGFVRMYNHERTLYMCHPAVMTLANYDKDNQTDLLKVLYTYLRQNCSLAHTAKEMNYHRNTILNKINRIQELADIDLSDPRWPEVLLFSCIVYDYMNQTW